MLLYNRARNQHPKYSHSSVNVRLNVSHLGIRINLKTIFFETQKGFRYKSVDQLIDQDPYEETYVYTPGIVEYKGPNNDFKIL